jgi:DNA/RNA-binding domain of Phe-tRNA-synthetase-like protein
MLATSERWNRTYPGAFIGVLAISNVTNPESCPPLDASKASLEAQLRSDFSGLSRAQLKSHPMLEPYSQYYRRFDKSYHVQHQLESIVLKGKPIPRVAALVEAMFMAELKNLLLTAGHDLDAVDGHLTLDVAAGSEAYTTLSDKEQTLKEGDMFIHDAQGVVSSILHGPDYRTRIKPETSRVVFTVYAPVGIAGARVRDHLQDLTQFVLMVSPGALVEARQVIDAKPSGR